MFTNNYINFKKLMFSGGSSNADRHPERLEFTEIGGESITPSSSAKRMYAQYSYHGDIGYWLNKATTSLPSTGVTNIEYGGVYFGSGLTPPEKTDFCLETPITRGLNITNQEKYTFIEDENGKQVYSSSYILTNTTGADMTINEVGVFTSIGNSDSNRYTVLMERSVFPEPVTIPAGGAKLVTLSLINNTILNIE